MRKSARISGTLGASYYIDYSYWKSVLADINRERERNNYSEAIKILDEFHSPFTSIILPGFIRSGGERASLRDEIYKEYESEFYAPIASEIDKISNSTFPEIDAVFYETLKRIETYLDNSHFASINPEHYAKVKGSAWYFEAARLFNIDSTSSQMTPDEEFEIILRCLNYEAPENWRERIQSRIDNLLRHWGRTSPSEGSPGSLEPYIDRAGQLINHPNISSEVADYLTERINSWREEQNARWLKLAGDWVNEANNVSPEEGLKMLSAHMSEKITPSVRIILETAQANLYRTAADNALNYYADDIEELQNVLKKFPAMPNADKERIAQKIAFLDEKRIEDRVKEINSSKTLGGLANVVKELGTDINVNSVRQAVNNTLSSLVNARIKDIEAEAGVIIRQNNFSDGKQEISNMIRKLQSDIQGAVDSSTARPHIEKARSLEQELLTSLMSANVEYCKGMFNSRKNTRSERDITMCLKVMNDFVSLWPEALRTREGSEINQVREFLSAIQGGVQGKLHIVSGNFAAADSFSDTPDMQIKIDINNDSYFTETIKDRVEPVFNQWIAITWSVGMSEVKFTGIEVDPMFNDEVFHAIVVSRGFKGYDKFNATLQNNGNSLTIRFEPDKNIPSCPW